VKNNAFSDFNVSQDTILSENVSLNLMMSNHSNEDFVGSQISQKNNQRQLPNLWTLQEKENYQLPKSNNFFAGTLDLQSGFGYTFYGRRDISRGENQALRGGGSGSCAQQNASLTKYKEYSDF